MSFKISAVGEAGDHTTTTVYEQSSEREQAIAEFVAEKLEEIAREVGGYVAISAHGELNFVAGKFGDSVNLQVNSLLRPDPPVEDAGLAAAAGSPRNFPPEASTAAPATEDNSPPAAQGLLA